MGFFSPLWRPRRFSWVVGACFGLLTLLGVALYRDYGVGWA
jgi:hypothetical protein